MHGENIPFAEESRILPAAVRVVVVDCEQKSETMHAPAKQKRVPRPYLGELFPGKLLFENPSNFLRSRFSYEVAPARLGKRG